LKGKLVFFIRKGEIMKKATICVLPLVFLMILSAMVYAGEINLPKTGQTTCYNSSGSFIDCTGTGQDGDVQAGIEWPSPRFEDNGDGTITDHLTGLVWLQNASCFPGMNWSDALSASNNLSSGTCGLTDGSVAGNWRLPNVIELESLVNYGVMRPYGWLNSQGFIDVRGANMYYWSGTTDANDSRYSWAVYYYKGIVFRNYKTSESHIWPVHVEK
jgi:Protein of unknown function (DUF1566)